MKKNIYLAVACTLLILGGGLYYFLRSEPVLPVHDKQEAKNSTSANITFTSNNIVEEQDGHKKWEINADSAKLDPDKKQLSLKNFRGTYYEDDGRTIVITAISARMNMNSKDIALTGSVKATSSDGRVFTAATLKWLRSKQHFYGSGGIMLSSGDTVITGNTIDSDAKIEKVKVQGNAHAVKGGIQQ